MNDKTFKMSKKHKADRWAQFFSAAAGLEVSDNGGKPNTAGTQVRDAAEIADGMLAAYCQRFEKPKKEKKVKNKTAA